MRRNHLRLDRSFVTVRGGAISVFVIVVLATVEVVRAFVLVGTAMLLYLLMTLPLCILS